MSYFVQRASEAALKESLYKNVNAMFWEAFASEDVDAMAYQAIVDEIRSSTKTEIYPFMEPPDGMKEWLGERPTTKIVDRVFSVDAKKWAQGVKIKLDDARDNRLGIYRDPITNLAGEARLLWNERVAAALEAGKSTTWVPDAQFFFDSDHPIAIDGEVSGTYQNNYDNTGSGGNAAFPLNYGNILTIQKNGRMLKKPNGKMMPIRYSHIVVGGDLLDKAIDLVTKNFIVPATAGSGVESTGVLQENSLRNPRLALGIIYLPQLTEANTWYMGAFDRKGARPVGLQLRENIRFQRVGAASANVEAEGADGEVVTETEYRHDYVEMGPRARGEAFLKWPWRLVRCNG